MNGAAARKARSKLLTTIWAVALLALLGGQLSLSANAGASDEPSSINSTDPVPISGRNVEENRQSSTYFSLYLANLSPATYANPNTEPIGVQMQAYGINSTNGLGTVLTSSSAVNNCLEGFSPTTTSLGKTFWPQAAWTATTPLAEMQFQSGRKKTNCGQILKQGQLLQTTWIQCDAKGGQVDPAWTANFAMVAGPKGANLNSPDALTEDDWQLDFNILPACGMASLNPGVQNPSPQACDLPSSPTATNPITGATYNTGTYAQTIAVAGMPCFWVYNPNPVTNGHNPNGFDSINLAPLTMYWTNGRQYLGQYLTIASQNGQVLAEYGRDGNVKYAPLPKSVPTGASCDESPSGYTEVTGCLFFTLSGQSPPLVASQETPTPTASPTTPTPTPTPTASQATSTATSAARTVATAGEPWRSHFSRIPLEHKPSARCASPATQVKVSEVLEHGSVARQLRKLKSTSHSVSLKVVAVDQNFNLLGRALFSKRVTNKARHGWQTERMTVKFERSISKLIYKTLGHKSVTLLVYPQETVNGHIMAPWKKIQLHRC